MRVFREVTKCWHWLPDFPMCGVQKLTDHGGRSRFLSDGELIASMDACRKVREPDFYLAVRIGLTTGLRKDNIVGPRWEQFDWQNEVAHRP